MLKRLQNRSEKLTSDLVNEVCRRYNCEAHPKVRLADLLPIEGSGISAELYSFALMSHFDVIVCDSAQFPLFAVEYDGPTHIELEEQITRDLKKDELCLRFNLPILRINRDFLYKEYRGITLLSWFIEVWFASRWFENAQKEGELPYDESFMPLSFSRIPGMEKPFPLWLSRSARAQIRKLFLDGLIQSFTPNAVVWIDNRCNYHCLAWIVIADDRVTFTKISMSSQHFPAPIHELLEDVTVVDLKEKLENILNEIDKPHSIQELNQEIRYYKSLYKCFSGGGQSYDHIESWY